MNKKVMILLLAVALIFSGCSKKNNDVTESDNGDSNNSIVIENTEDDDNSDIEDGQDVVINTVEEVEEVEDVEDVESESNAVITEEITVNTLEYDSIFTIPKSEIEILHNEMKIYNNYNSFTLTWEGENIHSYYKLYASSSEEGIFNFIKELHAEDNEDTALLPYSVSLKDFDLDTRVFLKISAVIVEDGKKVESPFGDVIEYQSKTVKELSNDELQLHLINKFPIFATDDQSVLFRFYDRYKVKETADEIKIISNLKGEYVSIFNDGMKSAHKDEILQMIQDVYTYVYEAREKKVIGIVEDELVITINDLENIEIDLK